MKKMMKMVVVMATMLMPLFLQAQSPLDKVAEKYTGKKGFKVVNISHDMLQLFVNMAQEKDTATQAFKRAVANMTGMKVIDVNCDSVKPALAQAFYNEATAAFPPAIYPELITGNNGGEIDRFLTRKNAKGQIIEFVMLEKGKREMVALSLTGIIDLATVSKIAKIMDIKGMDNMKKYKGTQKKQK